ncbi:MAG: bifunctional oligoribonuclease/PAP phosphatase NrnA [Deltaproteobacteria bacterium]|nr:MAG: bifunctional oligoribonuclease/PAP phosphatase NrnA [Deltaproteobacteria bacterium]
MPEQGPVSLLAALEGRRVLLSGPVGPDGDSLGACLALQHWLRTLGGDADVAAVLPQRYAFLPNAEGIVPDSRVEPGYDAVVVLDGDRHRLAPQVEAAFEAAEVRAIIDHHASTTEDGYTHFWVDGGAVSTCEMLFEAMQAAELPLDADLATMLYVGAIFDTGGFRYSNTRPSTHRMAAALLEAGVDHADIALKVLMERRLSALRLLGDVIADATSYCDGQVLVGRVPLAMAKRRKLRPGDLEGVVDALVHVKGVEVGALLIERRATRVKASLRSAGSLDVAALAAELVPSGGGHAKAAGAVVDCTLAELEERLVAKLARCLGAAETSMALASAGEADS